jgi:hypothetical protein
MLTMMFSGSEIVLDVASGRAWICRWPCSCSEWSSWKQNYMPGLETAPALPDKLLSLSDNDYIIHTSSTAQGGGGSFKNRKPIGEIGCCESRWQSESTEMKAAFRGASQARPTISSPVV